jgi:hypothetical protein
MNDGLEPVIWGFVGGLLGHSLRLIRHSEVPRELRPELAGDPMFWCSWFVLGAIGGVFALAYTRSGMKLPPILAINIGASAPLLAEKLISTLPAIGKAG